MGHSAHSINSRTQNERLRIVLTGKECYQRLFGNVYDWDCPYSVEYYSELIDREILQAINQLNLGANDCIEMLQNTFSHPSYIEWQTKRIPKNKFEKKLQEAVLTQSNDIYPVYYHQACVLRKQNKVTVVKKIKAFLMGILRKLKNKLFH